MKLEHVTSLYLAGPMTGYPEDNHPAFHAAAAALREEGYTVISPAETPQDADTLRGWEQALTYDIGQCVCPTDGIAVLPGFETSKGACLELHTALALGKKVILIPGQPESWRTRLVEWGRVSLAAMWREVDHGKYAGDHQDVAKAVQ